MSLYTYSQVFGMIFLRKRGKSVQPHAKKYGRFFFVPLHVLYSQKHQAESCDRPPSRILVYIIICVRFAQKGGAVATGGLATCECKMTIYQKAISNIGTEILFVQSNGHKTMKKWSFLGFKNGFRKLSSSSCVFRPQNASRSQKKTLFWKLVCDLGIAGPLF